jgi:hypothetical protein
MVLLTPLSLSLIQEIWQIQEALVAFDEKINQKSIFRQIAPLLSKTFTQKICGLYKDHFWRQQCH